MKLIPLTQSKFAMVDDEDYGYLMQWKWFAVKDKTTYYAGRKMYSNNKQKQIRLHSEIMKPTKGMFVDHEDRNGLNCQKLNLRLCNHAQNQANRKSFGVSKYNGVTYIKAIDRFIVRIRTNGKQKYIGQFSSEIMAAQSYDEVARKIHGKFANLNFK